jgi:hypothetical protein
MRELIEQLIFERKEQNKECRYLVIGKNQHERLFREISLTSPIPNAIQFIQTYQNLKVIRVESDIIEVVGDREI